MLYTEVSANSFVLSQDCHVSSLRIPMSKRMNNPKASTPSLSLTLRGVLLYMAIASLLPKRKAHATRTADRGARPKSGLAYLWSEAVNKREIIRWHINSFFQIQPVLLCSESDICDVLESPLWYFVGEKGSVKFFI